MNLGEIISSVKEGGRPGYDALRLAVAALDGLSTLDHMAVRRLSKTNREAAKEYEYLFNRWKAALGVTPKQYLGENFDPDSPGVQRRVAAARKFAEKFFPEVEEPT